MSDDDRSLTARVFDLSMKALLRQDPEALVALALPGVEAAARGPARVGDEPHLVDRRTDALVPVWVAGRAAWLALEFEVRARPDTALRLLTYAALQRRGLPSGEPILPAVVTLLRPSPRLTGRLRWGPPERPVLDFRYTVLRLDAMPARDLAADPRLAPLTPLGRGATAAEVARAAQRLRADPGVSEPVRRERLAVLDVLGGRLLGPSIRDIIRSTEVSMSWSYQQAVREGIARGREEGREEGRQQGREEGREEGRQQTRARAAERERRLLRKQLSLRFPGEVAAFAVLLDRCDADDRAWLAEALLIAASADALVADLRARLDGG